MDDKLIVKKERIREFDIARVFAIIAMIAVHTEYAIYNYGTPWFATLFDYLGSPFAAPTFMFILGANAFISSKNSPKQLFTRGIKLLCISMILNVVCHALPFFILGYMNNDIAYTESAIGWVFVVDILTFAGLAFIFFAAVRKFNINKIILVIIGIVASGVNLILVDYAPIDLSSNLILGAFTGLFYNSSEIACFSFLSWIIFPIAGYVFVQILMTVHNKDRFYLIVGSIGLVIYLSCILISYKCLPNLPFIEYTDEYSYYRMHPFNAFGTVAFLIAWISIMHFVAKIIPHAFDRHIARLNKNLTTIYVIQWFLINYCFVLASNNTFFVNEWQYILCFIAVIIASDFLAWLYTKYKEWKYK